MANSTSWLLRLPIVFACASTIGCVGGGVRIVRDDLSSKATARYLLRNCKDLVNDGPLPVPKQLYFLVPDPDSHGLDVFERSDDGFALITNWWTDKEGVLHYFGWGPYAGWEFVLPQKAQAGGRGTPGKFLKYGVGDGVMIKLIIQEGADGITKPLSKPILECELDALD